MEFQFLLFVVQALVYIPLRWLVFWFSFWEAAKERFSQLWLVWLIPQLAAIT